jgi:translation initiation factor 2B subunit (eIF-2B alpha/beta/delta family)
LAKVLILHHQAIEILKLAMTGEEDVEKSVIEHVINVRERLSEMRDIVGKNLTDKQSKMSSISSQSFSYVIHSFLRTFFKVPL